MRSPKLRTCLSITSGPTRGGQSLQGGSQQLWGLFVFPFGQSREEQHVVGPQTPLGSSRCYRKHFFSVSPFNVLFLLFWYLGTHSPPLFHLWSHIITQCLPNFLSFNPSSQGGNFSSAKDRQHPASRQKVRRFSGKRMRQISWTGFGSVQLLTNACLILQCKNSGMHFLWTQCCNTYSTWLGNQSGAEFWCFL